jgi:eukaryotic-like serine/threonine-protein kinase
LNALQVLVAVCDALLTLHREGYVHRDIKPGNVMWLPGCSRWTLIDFGCAARAGALAPLGYSAAYAAPEVVRAARAGERAMRVTKALDAWSLGLVALELILGQPIFPPATPRDQVLTTTHALHARAA